MASVEEKVKHIIVEQLGVEEEEVKPEASFVDDLGADSLDVVELVMALEEEFDISVDEVSLVTNYRSSFARAIKKNGVDGLIQTLKDRNQQP